MAVAVASHRETGHAGPSLYLPMTGALPSDPSPPICTFTRKKTTTTVTTADNPDQDQRATDNTATHGDLCLSNSSPEQGDVAATRDLPP